MRCHTFCFLHLANCLQYMQNLRFLKTTKWKGKGRSGLSGWFHGLTTNPAYLVVSLIEEKGLRVSESFLLGWTDGCPCLTPSSDLFLSTSWLEHKAANWMVRKWTEMGKGNEQVWDEIGGQKIIQSGVGQGISLQRDSLPFIIPLSLSLPVHSDIYYFPISFCSNEWNKVSRQNNLHHFANILRNHLFLPIFPVNSNKIRKEQLQYFRICVTNVALSFCKVIESCYGEECK